MKTLKHKSDMPMADIHNRVRGCCVSPLDQLQELLPGLWFVAAGATARSRRSVLEARSPNFLVGRAALDYRHRCSSLRGRRYTGPKNVIVIFRESADK